MSDRAPLSSGERLGGYELVERISSSSTGTVYRASNTLMDQTVLLKTMPAAASEHADVLKRFEREIRLAARLRHPNLVSAQHAGSDRGIHFMILDNVEGTDLARRVKENGPLPSDRAIDAICQAARGLAYLHRQGVCHRNIKPANLLLDENDQVLVTNMTTALVEEGANVDPSQQEELTRQGQILGTLEYMAPEQAVDAHKADHRSDQYSLGCTLHFLLTSKPPYQVKGQMKQLAAHSKDPIPSLRDTRDDVSAALDEVFQTMLAKNPEDRFASMDDAIAALQQALYGGGSKVADRKQAFPWELVVFVALAGVIVGALFFGVMLQYIS